MCRNSSASDSQAAVDADDLPRDIAGFVGAEEGDQSRHVFGNAKSIHGYASQHLGLQVFRKLLHHAGQDVAGSEGVGGNVPSSDFFGHRLW